MKRQVTVLIACVLLLATCVPAPAIEMASVQSVFSKVKYDVGRQLRYLQDSATASLAAIMSDGKVIPCPLKHTEVNAGISGSVARVHVEQTFTNPSKEKFEAVYTF